MKFAHLKAGTIAILATIVLALPAAAATRPQLVDQDGRTFTFATLRGEPLIVTFVAAHCTDACPLVNAQFAQAAQRFAHDRVRVRLLTITLDPEHDPPAVMRDLARRFGAHSRTWIVASGSVRDVHAVMAAFGVVAQRGRRGYADVHTTFVYFVDSRGNLRKELLASTALGRELVDDVRSNWRLLTQ